MDEKKQQELLEEISKSNKLILEGHKALEIKVDAANAEALKSGKLSAETKQALDEQITRVSALVDRVMACERELKAGVRASLDVEAKSLGEQFAQSEAFKQIQSGAAKSCRFEVKGGFAPLMFKVDTIVNAPKVPGAPLVPEMRVPGIVHPAERRLTIRDLLPVGQTESNLVYFAKENVFTDNAGPQYASPEKEGVTKPQSSISFTSATAEVITLACFFLVSKQVLEDAPMLQSYINGRGIYALKLEEEDELLNGAGTSGTLKGLLHSDNSTAYNREVTGDTYADTIRRAITQCALSEFSADAIILNPEDWETIELSKDSQERYTFANPQGIAGPTLWGRRVITTNSITQGKFLVGAFAMCAQIWDRTQATVELSREDGDNFKKNLVTLLFEERLALTVYRKTGIIRGDFPPIV